MLGNLITKQENYLSVLHDYKHEAQNVTIWVVGTSDQGGKEVPTQKLHKCGEHTALDELIDKEWTLI